MSGHPRDAERNEPGTGASRRDVLRGGAIGMGALVGAMALVNAEAGPAEATTGTGLRLSVGFSGINLALAVPLQSFTFGGDDVNGTLAPSQVILTLDTNRYSPRLLQAYVQKTSLQSVVIRERAPDVQGVLRLLMTITITGAEIVYFHTSAATHGHIRDTVHLVFGGSAEVNRNAEAVDYTWVLPST
jgi:hypothetical protein